MKKITMKKILSIFVVTTLGLFGVAATASAATADTNGDGYISTVEGQPFYGSVVTSLTTTGDTSASSALALGRFPTANASGGLSYERTFTVDQTIIDALTSTTQNVAIVQHGIDIDGSGSYDGEKPSSLNSAVPFEATVPAACGVSTSAGTNGSGNEVYDVALSQLNSTGASASSTIEILNATTGQVSVKIESQGLSPNLAHAQHFHFSASNNGGAVTCPPNTAGVTTDDNGDGYVSTVEGQPFYGSVVTSLTLTGGTGAADALALGRFPVADASGAITYSRALTGTSSVDSTVIDALQDASQNVAIVQHGIDINGSGAYDGDMVSSLNSAVPFEATVPANCGISEFSTTNTAGNEVYTVALDQLNSTGSSGSATIEILNAANGEVKVTLNSQGLSPNLPHAQHIHFSIENNGGAVTCPANLIGVQQTGVYDGQGGDDGNNGGNDVDNGTGGALEPVNVDEDDEDFDDEEDNEDEEMEEMNELTDEEAEELFTALAVSTAGLVDTYEELSVEQRMAINEVMEEILSQIADILEELKERVS